MKTHQHATHIRRRRPGLLALAALPVTLAAVIGLMLGARSANYSKDRMFSGLNRAQRFRLRIIGALTLLPLILVASPANAATGGTDAPSATHVPHVSAATGPARGKQLTHKRVSSPDLPDGSGSSSTFNSTNWDGYAVLNSSNTNTNSFNRVSAQWTEPTITCDPSNPNTQYALYFVGLDGWLSSSVEQGGTEAFCINGVPTHRMWWEMYPWNNITHSFLINPGDVIQASVTYNTSTSQFDIVVNDVTSSQALTQHIACQSGQANCARSSAEVISEDPAPGNDLDGLFYLANYGTATFTNVSVTDVNGHTGSLNDPTWNSIGATQVSSAGVTKQTVGPLSTDGTSFTTTWQHESGTPSAAPSPLSQGQPATALSKENDGTPASAAFDGNTGTRWSSQASDPQWIYVNLGAHATINKVVLNWENAYATAYQIQVSDDATNWTDIYSTTTGTGGIQTINVSGAGQYVRMYGTARATPYGYSLWEFQVFGSFDSGGGGCGTANVAQGQPATALSKENDGTPASAAFDGNTGTRWSSQFGDPQWIYVNLGAPVTVCQVVLNWESAYATAFQIQVSNDATNWTDIYSTTTGTGGIQTINASGTGQYVRMYGTARATPYGYSIWEFAVHTTGGGGTTNVAQGKPATADSSCATAETPDKAFNGSVSGGAGDKWCSLSSNRWLQVNLGQTYQVTSFILRNAGAGGENQAWDTRDADILVSTDGSTWSTAAQIRGNTADVTTVNLSSPVAAQYVKLNVITPTNTTDPAARIYEFEVYA